MHTIKRYAVEIAKRIVFIIIPLALGLDPLLRLTGSKFITTTIMVVYTYVSLVAIRWFQNRRSKS